MWKIFFLVLPIISDVVYIFSVCVSVRLSLSRVWLCNPLDSSPPSSSVHGISQARILEWVDIFSFKESSGSRDQTCISRVSCIPGGVFTTEAQGKLKSIDDIISFFLLFAFVVKILLTAIFS